MSSMRKCSVAASKTIVPLLCFLGETLMSAQGLTPQNKIKNDFPRLTARYGTQLGNQKAHYVFVLDISSSMLPYEAIEKQNLLKFVDA